MAFSKAGLQSDAEKVLNALSNKQNADGSWYFSYYTDGTSIYPSAGDKRPNGAIAWVAMAINTYKKTFSSTNYDTMATKTLNYLEGIKKSTIIGGVNHIVIPFAGVNSSDTTWDETDVASIEHNLDSYSAFHYFDEINNTSTYTTTRNQIRSTLEALWDSTNKRFYPGLVISTGVLDQTYYLDAQSWGTLSLGFQNSDNDVSYREGLDFNCTKFFEQSGYFIDQTSNYYGFFDYVHNTTFCME